MHRNHAEQSSPYFTLALLKRWVSRQLNLVCYLKKEKKKLKKNYPKSILKSIYGRAGPSPFCLSKSCPSPKALLKSNWCWRPVLPKPQPSTHYLQQITHFMFFLFNINELIRLCKVSAAARELSCSMWDLVLWLGIEPGSPALGAWSLRY